MQHLTYRPLPVLAEQYHADEPCSTFLAWMLCARPDHYDVMRDHLVATVHIHPYGSERPDSYVVEDGTWVILDGSSGERLTRWNVFFRRDFEPDPARPGHPRAYRYRPVHFVAEQVDGRAPLTAFTRDALCACEDQSVRIRVSPAQPTGYHVHRSSSSMFVYLVGDGDWIAREDDQLHYLVLDAEHCQTNFEPARGT